MKRITIIALSLFLVATTAVFAADEISLMDETDVIQTQDTTVEMATLSKNKHESQKDKQTKGKPSSENNGHYTIHVKTSQGNININDQNGEYAWWNESSISYNLNAIKEYVRKELNLSSDTEITLGEPRVTGIPGNGGNTTSIHFDATIKIPEITPPSEENPDDNPGGGNGNIPGDNPNEDIIDNPGEDIGDHSGNDPNENINDDSITTNNTTQKQQAAESDKSVSYTDAQPKTSDEAQVYAAIVALTIAAIAGVIIGLRRKQRKV